MKSSRPPASGPSQRPPLSRDRVIGTAVALADRQGLAALSMRRLAAALRVEAMSLYNHVSGKDDLLDGMVDLVVGEVALPAPRGDWRDEMRRRAVSAHEVFLRHPWAPGLITSRVTIGPSMLRYIDANIACLRNAGFSYAMADHAMNALDSHVYGFTLLELNLPIKPPDYASAARDYLPMLSREDYPHMYALSEMVARGEHSGVNDFDFGLNLILDGLERVRLEQKS